MSRFAQLLFRFAGLASLSALCMAITASPTPDVAIISPTLEASSSPNLDL